VVAHLASAVCKDFCFLKVLKICNFISMAKAAKKKSAKEPSNVFHNIVAASVKNNPKPKKKKTAK
jgi:hypothetical protein